MRNLLILAFLTSLTIFTYILQIRRSSVMSESYRTFLENIPMDTWTRKKLMNDGVGCINWATDTIASSTKGIQKDSAQLMAKVAINAPSKESFLVTQDLTLLINTALGLIDPGLPYTLEFDRARTVPIVPQKMVPQFMKGYFAVFGLTDSTQISATSQCALNIIDSLDIPISNASPVERRDFFYEANAYLDLPTAIYDAFGKCQKFNMVDIAPLKKFIKMFKHDPLLILERISITMLLDLPSILQAGINIRISLLEGRYEIAGSLFASKIRSIYNEAVF